MVKVDYGYVILMVILRMVIIFNQVMGCGEKQDQICLCNFTFAKALINCDFELDSPLYECKEIEEGLSVAIIAVTSYHCGKIRTSLL
jgi:hypothetical protein